MLSSRSETSSLVVTWKASRSDVMALVTSDRMLQSPRLMPEVAWKRTSAESGSPSRMEKTVRLAYEDSRSMLTKRCAPPRSQSKTCSTSPVASSRRIERPFDR